MDTLELYLTRSAASRPAPSNARASRSARRTPTQASRSPTGTPRCVRSSATSPACTARARKVRSRCSSTISRALRTLTHGPRGERDRALILLGWAGAFRASEFVGFSVDDVRFDEQGMHLHVQRSKRASTPALCAVRALWIGRLGRPRGPFVSPDRRRADRARAHLHALRESRRTEGRSRRPRRRLLGAFATRGTRHVGARPWRVRARDPGAWALAGPALRHALRPAAARSCPTLDRRRHPVANRARRAPSPLRRQ